MADRRLAGHAIGQDGAEGGARFQAHIPFGRGGEIRPRHFAEIIQRRQMRRHRQIAQGGLAAGKIAGGFRSRSDRAQRRFQPTAPSGCHLDARLSDIDDHHRRAGYFLAIYGRPAMERPQVEILRTSFTDEEVKKYPRPVG